MTVDRRIRRAIVPVAGKATRLFPASAAVAKGLFPLMDVDGVVRATLDIILRQARAGGIERFAIVVSPGQDQAFRAYFRRFDHLGDSPDWAKAEAERIADLAERITYITQDSPEGFGHAVWCARDFADGEPTLLMLGDHVPLASPGEPGPVEQLLGGFDRLGGVSVTATVVVGQDQARRRGVFAAEPIESPEGVDRPVYRAVGFVEKPDAGAARRLSTPGLPKGQVLAASGLYVLTDGFIAVLDDLVRRDRRENGEIQLASAQAQLIRERDDYYLLTVPGQSLDMGTPSGFAHTQSALALAWRAAQEAR